MAAEKERIEGKEKSPRAGPGPSADEEELEDDGWEDVEGDDDDDEDEEDEEGDEEEEEGEGMVNSSEPPSIALSTAEDQSKRGGGGTRASQGARTETNRLVALMLTVLEMCEETIVAVTKSMSSSGTGLGLWVGDEILRSSPLGALLPLVLFSANALFKVGSRYALPFLVIHIFDLL